MFDLTNDSDSDKNHQSGDMIDGRAGTSSVFSEDEDFERKKTDLAALVVWFSDLNATAKSLDDPVELCTGRAFAEILHIVDKDHFDEHWLDTIPEFTTKTNVMVKRSNLRKIWRKIYDYITESLHREVKSTRWTKIDDRVDGCEETDLPVALDLAMLIVTLAHVGNNKEDFVQYSKQMSVSSQQEQSIGNVVRMISMIMKEIPESPFYAECSNSSPEDGHDQSELNVSLSENSFRTANGGGRVSLSDTHAMDTLYAQLEDVQTEKDKLLKEVDRLSKQLEIVQNQSEGAKSSGSGETNAITMLEQINEELKHKKRQAEEKVHELEGQLEGIRPAMQELTIENEMLRLEKKDLNPLKSELQSAKDELEFFREKAEKVAIDQDVLKKRERENKDLQQQIKMLNSRLEHHVKQSTAEEDNKAGIMNLRQIIGKLKGEIETKDMELISKQQMIKKLEDELIMHKEKVKALDDRKEELMAERNALQEKLIKASETVITGKSLHDSIFDSQTSPDNSFSDKLSLEVENKRLLERIQELEELEPLQGEILTLKSRNGILEQETQLAIKQRDDVMKEVAELQEKMEKVQANVSGDVVELKVQLEKVSIDEQRARETAQKAENRLGDLETLLEKKTEQCRTYEKSLNQAKSLIDEMEQRNQPIGEETGTSVQQFRQIQTENERLAKRIADLEAELKTVTMTYEQENRLLTSAAHQMVVDRNVDSMLNTSSTTRRAEAGRESSMSTTSSTPSSLLSRQKMSGALAWRLVIFVMVIFGFSQMYMAHQMAPNA